MRDFKQIPEITEEDIEEFTKKSKAIEFDIQLMIRHIRIVENMSSGITDKIKDLMTNSKLFESFPPEMKSNLLKALRSTNEIKSQFSGSTDTE